MLVRQKSAALWAGFEASRGRILATLDGDGQNDPADLPILYQRLSAGDVDYINGYRRKRKDRWVRRIASKIANGFRNITTGRTVRDVGCSTRVFKRQCVARLPLFAGMHRFLPNFVAMYGYRIAEMPVNHRPRVGGNSKYTIGNRLWVGLYDLIGVAWFKRRAFHCRIKSQSSTDQNNTDQSDTHRTN